MKKLFLLLTFTLFLIRLVSQTANSTGSHSSSFHQFIDNFETGELPIDFSLRGTFYNGDRINLENLEKYICEYDNFCFNTFSYGSQKYFYSTRLNTSKNFYALIYISRDADIKTQHVQFILVTYSKLDFRKIDKIVLCGYKEAKYFIHTKISEDFEIESTLLYTYQFADNPYKDPNVFRLMEIKSKYIINDEGQIIKVEESKPLTYPAKSVHDKISRIPFSYPVDVEEE